MDKPMMQIPIPAVETMELIVPGEKSFDSLVARRQEIAKVQEALKKERAELDMQIGAILDLNQLKTVTWQNEWIISRREGAKPRPTLDKMKLMELGVAPTVIMEATKYGKPGSPGVTIRKMGETEEQEPDGYWTN